MIEPSCQPRLPERACVQRSGNMIDRSLVRVRVLAVLLGVVSALGSGCDDDDDCSDGSCVCDSGESCEFDCPSPPCTVHCEGDNDECSGTCANGDCSCGDDSHCAFRCGAPPCHVACDGAFCSGTCANGDCRCGIRSACSFSCLSPPCHVSCEGQNPSCAGSCANGNCTCAAGSECAFTCLDHNCGVICEAGSRCTLTCPEGTPGTQGCEIDCAAGSAVSCPNGSLACGMPCPT